MEGVTPIKQPTTQPVLLPVPRETLEERRRLMSRDAFPGEFSVRYVLHGAGARFPGCG